MVLPSTAAGLGRLVSVEPGSLSAAASAPNFCTNRTLVHFCQIHILPAGPGVERFSATTPTLRSPRSERVSLCVAVCEGEKDPLLRSASAGPRAVSATSLLTVTGASQGDPRCSNVCLLVVCAHFRAVIPVRVRVESINTFAIWFVTSSFASAVEHFACSSLNCLQRSSRTVALSA